ncbi:hypothetical protein BZG14_13805 [Salinivibrio sp. IB282]|nr:hypothetical protein BZG14_13805 [Salinivibrio sp. IB282]
MPHHWSLVNNACAPASVCFYYRCMRKRTSRPCRHNYPYMAAKRLKYSLDKVRSAISINVCADRIGIEHVPSYMAL